MDADKLNEAAYIFAHVQAVSSPYREDDFKSGANWLMAQPLADRLTDEEKERIIKKYKFNDEAGLATAIRTGEMANKHILMRDLLEDIFGEKLFNEK